jgi:MOSC domain-containing protein YiiM
MIDLSEDNALQGSIVAVAANSEHRFSKPIKDTITLIEGHGVEGDAHAGRFIKHRYLEKQKPNLFNTRQVHLITSELFVHLSLLGFKVTPGNLGENMTTQGLDLERLPLGTRLHIGPLAVVELTGLRTPCGLIDRFQKGLKRVMIGAKSDFPRFRCGVLGVVNHGGVVTVGDAMRAKLPMRPSTALPAL